MQLYKFSLSPRNTCDSSADKITNDHRPLSTRTGLPRLPPRYALRLALNLRSSPYTFPNSYLGSYIFFQYTLYL